MSEKHADFLICDDPLPVVTMPNGSGWHEATGAQIMEDLEHLLKKAQEDSKGVYPAPQQRPTLLTRTEYDFVTRTYTLPQDEATLDRWYRIYPEAVRYKEPMMNKTITMPAGEYAGLTEVVDDVAVPKMTHEEIEAAVKDSIQAQAKLQAAGELVHGMNKAEARQALEALGAVFDADGSHFRYEGFHANLQGNRGEVGTSGKNKAKRKAQRRARRKNRSK